MIKKADNKSSLWLLKTVITAVGIALYWWANTCGLGHTPDSFAYIRIADQIQKMGLFWAPGLKVFPPILPLLISLLGQSGMIIFNAICLVTVLLVSFSFESRLQSKPLKVTYILLIGGLTPLYLVSSFLWTEILFTVLILLVVYLFQKLDVMKRPSIMITLVILLFMMPLLRYAAVFILFPLVVILFYFTPKGKTKLILGIGLFIASVLLSSWVILFQEGFQNRFQNMWGPLVNLDFDLYTSNGAAFLQALGSIAIPLKLGSTIVQIGGCALLICIGFGLRNSLKNKWIVDSSFLLVFVFYYFSLHFVFPIEYDTADRYLTPLYPFLIFTLLRTLDKFFQENSAVAKNILLSVIIAVCTYGYFRTVKNINFWHEIRCPQNKVSQKQAYKFQFISLPEIQLD